MELTENVLRDHDELLTKYGYHLTKEDIEEAKESIEEYANLCHDKKKEESIHVR